MSSSKTSVWIQWLKGQLRPTLGFLALQTPTARLMRLSARRNWGLLAITVGTSLFGSFSEGATLGVIFLAIGLLTKTRVGSLDQLPAVQGLPWLKSWLSLVSHWPVLHLFVALIGLALVLQLLLAMCTYGNAVASGYFGARLGREITGLLNRRILSFSYACASRYRVGDLLDYARYAGDTVQGQIYIANNLITNLFQISIYLFVLYTLSAWLLLVACVLAGLLWFVQSKLVPRIRRNAKSSQQVSVELSVRITENIQGLRMLHSSGSIAYANERYQGLLRDKERYLRRDARLQNIVTPLVSFLPIGMISLLAIGSVMVFSNRTSGILPNLVTFVLALQRLNLRMGGMANLATGYAAATAHVNRLNEVLSDHDKQFVRQGGIPFSYLKDRIELRNVYLRYGNSKKPALQNINLEIARNSTVALVGASGAGKSSLADLLVGLYEPSEGQILVDGTPLEKLDLASWQQRLGVVSQDTFLLNDTITANIAYGLPQATLEQVMAAATMAQAAGFIEELPEGYSTLLGERGYRLSGGQRQRLSLARALMRDPDLLILDEATSALDTHSERLVQQAIENYEKRHTVLVIAHRLSTIVNADLICVMEKGQIVERGTHQELLRLDQRYASLWHSQIVLNR